MIDRALIALCLTLMMSLPLAFGDEMSPAALIPAPQQVRWEQGEFVVPKALVISVPKSQADKLATATEALKRVLVESKSVPTVTPRDDGAGASSGIDLSIDPKSVTQKEGYQLIIRPAGIAVIGADGAGVFYGVQTLGQLLRQQPDGAHVPCGQIVDYPAFALRGFMHDVGRNFQTVDSLKAQLDRFAAYKLNTFHFHLTDNPGWRIECKAFPQLNDPKNHTRDKGLIYTYEQLREIIAYARARHIQVIPELDMPGHSAYFKPAMGFTMDSDEGMLALETIIDEFCAQIPAGDCPIIHLGSDEVRIKNPRQFIERMTARVRANGRQVMMWNPGLPGDAQAIMQIWQEKAAKNTFADSKGPFVDSANGYLNNLDPYGGVQRYFFHQNALHARGDATALGGILCCWPDIRVEDKSKIAMQNAQWPVMLAFADAIWHGRAEDAPDYFAVLPPEGSDAMRAYQDFESRLIAHRDRFFADEPFPFVKTTQIAWRVVGPFARDKATPGDTPFPPEKSDAQQAAFKDSIRVNGGTIMLQGRWKDGVFHDRPQNLATAYGLTYIYADADRTLSAICGFEAPFRSNRLYGGIPQQGQWDAFGANIWINDTPVPPPTWKEPGKYAASSSIWSGPKAEQPYTDEEFYWTRPPVEIPLKKGWNKVLIRAPRGYAEQNWSFTFIPVRRSGNGKYWIEDSSLRFDPDAQP